MIQVCHNWLNCSILSLHLMLSGLKKKKEPHNYIIHLYTYVGVYIYIYLNISQRYCLLTTANRECLLNYMFRKRERENVMCIVKLVCVVRVFGWGKKVNFILGWILEDTEQKEVFVYLLRIEKKKKLKSWDLFLV